MFLSGPERCCHTPHCKECRNAYIDHPDAPDDENSVTPLCRKDLPDQGGMVVVAPIGTKPLLGGNFRTVPAGTLSGFLMLLTSTSAGALKLNFCAIPNNDSPGSTVYVRNWPVEIVVVVATTLVVVVDEDDDELSPSVNNPEIIARNPKRHVLHNRYICSRVRKNIHSMLCQQAGVGAPSVSNRSALLT